MRDKVCVYVLVASLQRTFEFRIPFDLTVAQVADLVAHLVEQRAAPFFAAGDATGLVLLEGSTAGRPLEAIRTVRSLHLSGDVVDGTRMALV